MIDADKAEIAALGTREAASVWRCAMIAIHQFASASNCPAGENVITWFTMKSADVQREYARQSATALDRTIKAASDDEIEAMIEQSKREDR